MDDAIFKINTNKTDESFDYIYYTCLGNHKEIDDEGNPRTDNKDNCLAYIRNGETDKQYYIKVGTYGKIYNPIGLYSEGRSKKFLSKIGRNEYNFTKVNQKVFDMYINFLRTKNIAWLNNAERELA